MTTATAQSVTVTGIGLVTGQPSKVTLTPAAEGTGVTFYLNSKTIPARLEYVVDANRGVTLANDGQMLILVEHFLAACGMLKQWDWDVHIEGAPELPILDGSSIQWAEAINTLGLKVADSRSFDLKTPVTFVHPERENLYCHALPNSSGCKITCLSDFPHPDLKSRWMTFDAKQTDWLKEVAIARTFGFVAELPKLQEMGLAKGVSLENTLGLNEDGSYTSELRVPDECLRHKVLDFIGDMTLCGIPVLSMNAHFILMKSGHQAHIEFGKLLKASL